MFLFVRKDYRLATLPHNSDIEYRRWWSHVRSDHNLPEMPVVPSVSSCHQPDLCSVSVVPHFLLLLMMVLTVLHGLLYPSPDRYFSTIRSGSFFGPPSRMQPQTFKQILQRQLTLIWFQSESLSWMAGVSCLPTGMILNVMV